MDIETAREYCLAKKAVTECLPFDEYSLVMKVMDKISEYCTIEDIHMKEAELEDILKEIYKGVHKC